MKKNFTFKAVLLTALFIVFGFALKAQTNLLSNPSFETWTEGKPDGWKLKINNGIITEEVSIVAEGAKAIKLTCPDKNKTASISQSVKVTAGKTYQLTMQYYIENGDGEDLRVWSNFKKGGTFFKDPELGDELKNMLKGPDNGYFPDERGAWKTYSIEFTAPANADEFVFEFRQYKGSVAYWDNMSFVEKGGEVTPILSATPNSLSFSSSVNTPADAQTITVSGVNLTKTPTYSISGADAAMFAASGTLTISGGDIAVTFTPTSDGNKSATLTVTSGDLTKAVTLSGAVTSTANPYGLDDTNPLSTLNEDFESGLPATWKTAAEQGDRNWGQRTYNDNGYMQMSAYKGTGAYKTLLISPALDFDKISKNNVRFDWKAGYANGATLKVSVMTKDGTKTEVKSIKATEPSGGYAANFATETLDLSAQSGIKFLVFEYNGDADASQTTTYQIDNVRVELAQSIDQVQSTLKIYASNAQLCIENDGSAKIIQVYNVLGRKLLEKTATAGLNTIAVEKGQLLIVKAGKKVAKVIVK